MTDRPDELHLVRHREVRWVLVPTIAVAAAGAAVWIGTVVFGDGDGDGWSTAGFGIALLSAVGLGLWLVLSVWLRTNERRHAERVLADALAVWPQYSTRAQWAKVVESVVESQRADPLQVVGPAAVFTAAALLITGVAAVSGDAGTALGIGAAALAALWVGAAFVVAGRAVVQRRIRDRTRRRLTAIEPYPRCWVSEDGAYFEDTGLVRFHRLSEVSVVEPGGVSAHRRALKDAGRTTGMLTDLTPLDTRLSTSGWALLAATSDSTKAHTFWLRVERAMRGQRQRYEWVNTVHVRVPPDQLYEAHELAARIRRRWLAGG